MFLLIQLLYIFNMVSIMCRFNFVKVSFWLLYCFLCSWYYIIAYLVGSSWSAWPVGRPGFWARWALSLRVRFGLTLSQISLVLAESRIAPIQLIHLLGDERIICVSTVDMAQEVCNYVVVNVGVTVGVIVVDQIGKV